MRPNFALDFRETSIVLLHQTGDEWAELGSVALDDPDMAEALDALRHEAEALAPEGLATKLIIPNSQILYTEVVLSDEANALASEARDAALREALDGRTPYALDELVYDSCDDGPKLLLAVLARDTLDEAQDFAVQHRFNPVCFVAIPPEGRFRGEVWFGESALVQNPAPLDEARDAESADATGVIAAKDLHAISPDRQSDADHDTTLDLPLADRYEPAASTAAAPAAASTAAAAAAAAAATATAAATPVIVSRGTAPGATSASATASATISEVAAASGSAAVST